MLNCILIADVMSQAINLPLSKDRFELQSNITLVLQTQRQTKLVR